MGAEGSAPIYIWVKCAENRDENPYIISTALLITLKTNFILINKNFRKINL